MEDILLIFLLIAVFAVGYVAVVFFGRFMDELYRDPHGRQDTEKDTAIVSTGKKSAANGKRKNPFSKRT